MTNILKEEDIYEFKIIFLGDTSSGNVQFISRFWEDRFDNDPVATLGVDVR